MQTAILTRSKVRALARNPVMLTCLCAVHWNRDLPDVRSRVYDAVIHWLLNARAEMRRERFGLEPEVAERALSLLALEGMTTGRGKQSIFELSSALTSVRPALERYFEPVEELSGGRLRFWHLTFQAYLAALELARGERERWWGVLSQRFDQAQWWETTELFATCLYDLGQPESVDGLLEPLLETGVAGDLRTEARMVGIVGRLLQPLTVCRYPPAAELANESFFQQFVDMGLLRRLGRSRIA